MKRISLLVLILFGCCVPLALAQQTTFRMKSRPSPHTARMAETAASSSYLMQSVASQNRTWELGTYPGGTWAALGDINDFGVAVGAGDVPPIGLDGGGETHTLAVRVLGPHAGEWIDLGTLGQATVGWEEPINGISNTGIIVGHSTMPDGYVHGFVWTEKSGISDLGTLADIGYPKYNSSWATSINKLGTLIVGWSGVEVSCLDCAPALPVVWTPSISWKNGHLVTSWKIHKLDTAGFPNLTRWYVFSVNDFGQIIAIAWNEEETIGIPILWNLQGSGKWKALALAADPEQPYIIPFSLNNRGEIAGSAVTIDGNWFPRLWKPLNLSRRSYSSPIALALPEGYSGGAYADGINDRGDITGECWGDAPTSPAALWNTKDATFVEVLASPGDWATSFSVNNNRIAALYYGGGDNCPADTYGSCAGAIQLP